MSKYVHILYGFRILCGAAVEDVESISWRQRTKIPSKVTCKACRKATKDIVVYMPWEGPIGLGIETARKLQEMKADSRLPTRKGMRDE